MMKMERKRRHIMGQAYEFDGELFTNVNSFLDAVAHEYKTGDENYALTALEDYGFDISDIGVRPDRR
jgi:hypothetical protein